MSFEKIDTSEVLNALEAYIADPRIGKLAVIFPDDTGEQPEQMVDPAENIDIETDETGWRQRANCRVKDPELFFPERGESTRAAKEVCRCCTVAQFCLEYALRNKIGHGIWGGRSEEERRRLRRAAR